MTGRPTKRTPELVDEIISRIANGEFLAVICREEGKPHRSTFMDWVEADPDLSRRYARARDDGEELILLSTVAISDDREDDPASRRVRVETRLKALAKFNPKRWGERQAVEHSGPGGAPLPVPQFVIQPVKAKDDE